MGTKSKNQRMTGWVRADMSIISRQQLPSRSVVITVCSAGLLTLPTYSILPGLNIRDSFDWLGATILVSKVMLPSEHEDSTLICHICFDLVMTFPLNPEPEALRIKPSAPKLTDSNTQGEH